MLKIFKKKKKENIKKKKKKKKKFYIITYSAHKCMLKRPPVPIPPILERAPHS